VYSNILEERKKRRKYAKRFKEEEKAPPLMALEIVLSCECVLILFYYNCYIYGSL